VCVCVCVSYDPHSHSHASKRGGKRAAKPNPTCPKGAYTRQTLDIWQSNTYASKNVGNIIIIIMRRGRVGVGAYMWRVWVYELLGVCGLMRAYERVPPSVWECAPEVYESVRLSSSVWECTPVLNPLISQMCCCFIHSWYQRVAACADMNHIKVLRSRRTATPQRLDINVLQYINHTYLHVYSCICLFTSLVIDERNRRIYEGVIQYEGGFIYAIYIIIWVVVFICE